MIDHSLKQTILNLAQMGHSQRRISKLLSVSRNTVKKVTTQKDSEPETVEAESETSLIKQIKALYINCQGNAVRIHESLADAGIHIAYSSVTNLIRKYHIRERKPCVGEFTFEPGEEMQHDTSPHHVIINKKKERAQCSAVILAYSRKLYVQYYPCFTRFEAKVFLDDALTFFSGSARNCVVDNTSVILAAGAGSDAVIAAEMKSFGLGYGFIFIAHAVGRPERKGRIERSFLYIEKNFLAGREFSSWDDLNTRAREWCINVANQKEKKALGMSPEAAYIQEKPYLNPLPKVRPPVYGYFNRTVDTSGCINLDTNRYSVPEKYIGCAVDVYKYMETINIHHKQKMITKHERLIGQRNVRSINKSHHPSIYQRARRTAACEAEEILRHAEPCVINYIKKLKPTLRGRGMRQFNQLLSLKRTYPEDAFLYAIQQACHYGLYDLKRLEDLIIKYVAGEYFNIN